ncbi:Sister chromatid cohesion protein dcc15 / FY16936)) [Taphrina deformans PYCC 5710]|uniref:Sister chromatid cohesion protein dcc15 / FY16936 n=1 Tax=Taphrina deformans (strain PYCC 5710 / ATCC 11124 / CBS 356.35 / IMI 108563 / JCM 9778 / NBRC 8474) TaxID=1097556 RepID=R4XG82_TAPDE|nr:Sister chromatid cohesion protein dcc15 / FY16936)) [Taphrina deformans PYCC 5710]|eukprot:CCG82394.1 Sister chromatid cohesion protein dcc15 / FY16936)) [Taphrina deformans PYCC 5710]
MSAAAEVMFHRSSPEQYILVQVTPEILDQELFIKPVSSNSTVLCTNSSTYQLKDVQQSNSLLFLSSSAPEKLQVQGEAASWLEAVLKLKPKIDLSCVPIFDGGQAIGVQGITQDVLFSRLPASNAEIHGALHKNLCINLHDGYVRLEPDYVLKLLKLLVDTIVAEGLDLNALESNHVLKLTYEDNENQDVLAFLLDRFSVHTTKSEAAHARTGIDGLEVARYTGTATLSLHANSPIGTTRFAALWAQATPLPFQQYCKDFQILGGHYIQPVSTQIQYFASDELSVDGKQRIVQLLDVKERWLESEMLPFLLELEGGQKVAQSLIMKHARKVKVGKTTFIERRGK